MSLTGSLFLDGIIVVTVLAFVAVVLVWPRLTGSGAGHILGRVAVLAALNAMVLLTAVTQVNAAYLFFASWGDLGGALTGHVAQTSLDRGGAAASAPNIAVRGVVAPAVLHVPTLARPVGSTGLLTYTVHGALSGLTGTVLVQLPPGYTARSAGSRRYPVLEAFHGYPSEPQGWVKNFDIRRQIDQQVAAHTLAPTLVVVPQIEFPSGVDTEGVDGAPGQPQVETWLTRDVPDWLARHFRVDHHRNAWATIGDSAGGWDAAMATVLHPAQYGAAIVLGGYFHPDFGPFYEPFPPTSSAARHYDLARVVAHHSPPVDLWVETSHADALSYGSTARFLRAARSPMAVHAVVLQNAGHRLSVWIPLVRRPLSGSAPTCRGSTPERRTATGLLRLARFTAGS